MNINIFNRRYDNEKKQGLEIHVFHRTSATRTSAVQQQEPSGLQQPRIGFSNNMEHLVHVTTYSSMASTDAKVFYRSRLPREWINLDICFLNHNHIE